MPTKYNEIQEFLKARADLHARLNLLPYDGTPEIKERGDGKYFRRRPHSWCSGNDWWFILCSGFTE